MQMQHFATADFYLASYLRCKSYELTDVRRDGPRCVFVFSDKPDRRETVMSYYGNKATVRPLEFVATIKQMKSLIHNI